MNNHTNFNRDFTNTEKKFIKTFCVLFPVGLLFYGAYISSEVMMISSFFVGIPFLALAISIPLDKNKLENNPFISTSYSRYHVKKKTSKGIFSVFTLYFLSAVIFATAFLMDLDDYKAPALLIGITSSLFTLARKRSGK